MSAVKKKKTNSWNEDPENTRNGMTATKTELDADFDTAVQEIMQAAKKNEPSLILIQGENMGEVYRLRNGRNIIGRHPSSDIVLNQRAVSSQHTTIKVDKSSIILEDNDSTNGTILNKDKITRPVILQAGDLIKIGTCVFKYVETSLDVKFTETLHSQGTKDPLTEIYNKGYVTKALKSSVDIAKAGHSLSIIMIDIDHFKKINDTYGHVAGDVILKEFAVLVRKSGIRNEDVFGRFGGEEFILILPDSPSHIAIEIAERIRQKIERHNFEHDSNVIKITSSMGVCHWSDRFSTAEEFLEKADANLYLSKQNGRNRVTIDEV